MCIWIFWGSGSAKFVVLLGVGLPGNDAVGVMLPVTRFPTTSPWVLWDGRPHSHTRSSGPRHIPPRNSGTGSGPPPGAGVGH